MQYFPTITTPKFTLPDLSGYVPYTGATSNVGLGAFNLTATKLYFGATGQHPIQTNTGTSAGTSVLIGLDTPVTTANTSVAIGRYAMKNALTSSNSVVIGDGAGQMNLAARAIASCTYVGSGSGANANGGSNTFIGFNSGTGVTGSNLVGIGSSVFSASIGSLSVAFGQAALGGSNNPGGGNVAIGYQAGNGSSGAQYVFFLGENTGRDSLNCQSTLFAGGSAGYGANNVDGGIYMGTGAGQNAINAGSNVALGTNSGNSATGSYNAYVGLNSGGSSNGSYNLYLGAGSGGGSIASNTVAIGQDSGIQLLNVQQGLFLGTNTGGLAYYATYSTFLGLASGYNAERASRSLFIGTSTGYGAKDAASCLFIGNYAGINDTVDTAYRGGLAGTIGIYGTGYLWNVDDEATVTSGDGNAVVKVTAIDYGGAGTVSVSGGGSYYMVGDQVYLNGGSNNCIVEVVAIDGIAGEIATAEVVNGGSGYTNGDTLTVDGGYNGSIQVTGVDGGAGEVYSVSANSDGTGYAIDDTFYINAGDNLAIAKVTSVGGSGEVTGVEIVFGGLAYGVQAGVTTTVITGTGDGNATINVDAVYLGAVTSFDVVAGSGLYYVQQYSCSGGTGSGLHINVLTLTGTYQGAVTNVNSIISPGSGYQLGTYPTTNSSGYYFGSGLSVNIDTMVLGTPTALSVVSAGTGYKQGGQAGENATTANFGSGTDLYVIINSLASEVSNGSAMLLGDYTSTGGYKNSMAIGFGTMNSASAQANIGSVLFLDGINTSSTPTATPIATSKMTMLGGQVWGYVAKTANYTVLTTDYLINCTANSFTVTLPTASGIAGQTFIIKNSGTGTITVDGNGSETIDGVTTQTLTQWDSMTIMSNGSNWIIN